jgi:hypothetical protein
MSKIRGEAEAIMPREDLNRIKEQLNKAMARWWIRKREII